MHPTASARRLWLLVLMMVLVALVATSCGRAPTVNTVPTEETQPMPTNNTETDPLQVAAANAGVVRSEQPRQTAPAVTEADLAELVAGNNAFAFDLYQELQDRDGNIFYSPYSISLALAMTYAGARDSTEQQMADALHFTLPQEDLHPAFNALDLALPRSGDEPTPEPEDQEATPFKLHIANALWGQTGYAFRPEFLDLLAANYGAGMRVLDFQSAPDASRATINDWVSEQTEDKINELIPAGMINSLTRLVLTNAIYFNAAWLHPFEASATQDDTFNLLDGSQVTVPMMAQTERLRYAAGAGYQAVELPYHNGVSMVILLPEAGQFATFEDALTAEQVQMIVADLSSTEVVLTMPKFDLKGTSFSLKNTLTKLGMPDAFGPGVADFSGMDGTRELFIGDVVHQAAITLDEKGTEAAAATAVGMAATSAQVEPTPPVEVRIDRPFVYMIRDNNTGTILFVGRIVNPNA